MKLGIAARCRQEAITVNLTYQLDDESEVFCRQSVPSRFPHNAPQERTLPRHSFTSQLDFVPRGDSSIQMQGFDGIVGSSQALRDALDLALTVAPTNSTVLIQGETGTGKELIAQAIHRYGQRSERPFVKLNCAAIPLGLLESELFGHERGAFTGAIARKVGRFEAADRGSLFLDEIGDTPIEIQTKLLRVLQEGEFERLGGTETLRVNVRLIGATHRDLMAMISGGEFRSDLYYRLNVFPISVPPLRDRPEDIAPLVMHFMQTFSELMNKNVVNVPEAAMTAMREYPWPGNIRELRNFIERSVILSPGHTLRPPLAALRQQLKLAPGVPVTLEDAERQHIRKTLEHLQGKVGGPKGAAARLGIKRTTLYFRMKKLGISRSRQTGTERSHRCSEIQL
jgi:formate hydrogenlyase transcriptional activator